MSVNLTIAPNPFTQDRALLTRPAGGTLKQVLESTGWPADHMAVCLDGVPIPPDRWEWLMPQEGQLITARVYPRGAGGNSRGKNVGRLVAGVVLIVAAVATMNAGIGLTAAQVAGGGILGISSGTIGLAGTALVAAGALGLISPVPKPLKSSSTSDTFSIAGTRNVFDPYGVVPKVFGAPRTYPKVAAIPFTEIAGSDQYLRMVFEVGYGPLTISDLRIGETAIDDFGEVQYEIREGTPEDAPLTLYTRDVVEEALSILLANAAGWLTQTTALETDEISIDVSALGGFGRWDNAGNLKPEIVYLRVQYAPAGTGSWVNMPGGDVETGSLTDVSNTNPVRVSSPSTSGRLFDGDVLSFAGMTGMTELNGNSYTIGNVGPAHFDLVGVDGTSFGTFLPGSGGWTRQGGIFVQTRSASIVRRNKTWAVDRGQYDVRIMRMDPDETASNIADKLTWTALRSFTNRPPITATGRALIAIRIKASEKLNGVVEELNCVAQAQVPIYDGAAWSVGESRNPAWAYADLLCGSWRNNPMPLTRLLANTAGDCLGLAVDTDWTMEVDKVYGVRIRLGADNDSLVKDVTTVAGTSQQVLFVEPIASGGTFPQVGDLVMFGESGLETIEGIVKAIEPFDGIHAKITLIDAAPGVHLADQGDIPAYQSHITLPANVVGLSLAPPVILSHNSDEFTLLRGPDGSLQSRIVVRLGLSSGAAGQTRFFEGQSRLLGESAWSGLPLVTVDPGELIIMPVQDGEAYEFRVRALSGLGAASDWTVPVPHTVIGKTSPPPDVDLFTIARDADGTRRFAWSLTEPPDFAGVQIKYKAGTGHDWDDLDTLLHTGALLTSPFETNLIPAGTYVFGIKAIDTSGNESENAKLIEGTLPNPRLAGALVQMSARAQAFPGTRTGCDLENGILVAVSTKSWDDLDNDPITWADWTSWNFAPANPIQYDHPAIDLGAVLPFTPLVTVTGQGTPTITEAHSDDDVSYTSYAALGPQVTARYIKFRVSQAHAAATIEDVFMILDAQATTDINNDLDTSTISSPAGTFRIPLNKNFSLITQAGIILQNVGPGWTFEMIDRDAALGPQFKIYDNTGTLADAVIDTFVSGIV